MPFNSQLTTRRPNDRSVLTSSSTLIPAARSCSVRAAAASPAPSSVRTARTTTWTGANRGGTRSPASSPWAMMMAPIRREDAPQEVCQAKLCWPPSSRNVMPNALAKPCPNSWLVPIWRALPSLIMASVVHVVLAPAKRSRSVLRPTKTGTARTLTMKSS